MQHMLVILQDTWQSLHVLLDPERVPSHLLYAKCVRKSYEL